MTTYTRYADIPVGARLRVVECPILPHIVGTTGTWDRRHGYLALHYDTPYNTATHSSWPGAGTVMETLARRWNSDTKSSIPNGTRLRIVEVRPDSDVPLGTTGTWWKVGDPNNPMSEDGIFFDRPVGYIVRSHLRRTTTVVEEILDEPTFTAPTARIWSKDSGASGTTLGIPEGITVRILQYNHRTDSRRVGQMGTTTIRGGRMAVLLADRSDWFVNWTQIQEVLPEAEPVVATPRVWSKDTPAVHLPGLPVGTRVRVVEYEGATGDTRYVGRTGVIVTSATGLTKVRLDRDGTNVTGDIGRWTRIEEILPEPVVTRVPREHIRRTGQMPANPTPRARIITHTDPALVGTVVSANTAYRSDSNSTGVLLDREGVESTDFDGMIFADPGPGPYEVVDETVDEVVTATATQAVDWEAKYWDTWIRLDREAERRGWCSEYDRIARELNGPARGTASRRGAPEPPRPVRRTVTVRVEVDALPDASPAALVNAALETARTSPGRVSYHSATGGPTVNPF